MTKQKRIYLYRPLKDVPDYIIDDLGTEQPVMIRNNPIGAERQCLANATDYWREHGGQIVLGYAVFEMPGVRITAEKHVVNLADGKWMDTTKDSMGDREMQFLPKCYVDTDVETLQVWEEMPLSNEWTLCKGKYAERVKRASAEMKSAHERFLEEVINTPENTARLVREATAAHEDILNVALELKRRDELRAKQKLARKAKKAERKRRAA